MISLVTDTINQNDIDGLIEWLKTNPRLTKGDLTIEFEEKWSKWLSPHEEIYSVYVNSGSSANLLMTYATMKANQLKNHKIVVPALSWATTVSPAMQLGLEPILCEVDKDTLSVDLNDLELIFENNEPAAFILVHALGFPAKMKEIMALCKKYDVILLEDSCETVGSTYNGKKTGTFGQMSTFSFYFGHHISTIEGGMVCTKDKALYKLLLMLRSHGWDRDLCESEKSSLRDHYGVDEFKSMYTFYCPGFNLRSTDLQAKLGLGQMEKIDDICSHRDKNFRKYHDLIQNDYWKVNPYEIENELISNFAYPMIHPRSKEIINKLKENEIEVRPIISGSMASQPFFYEKHGKYKFDFAEIIDQFGFYLPNNHGIGDVEIEYIAGIVNSFMEKK